MVSVLCVLNVINMLNVLNVLHMLNMPNAHGEIVGLLGLFFCSVFENENFDPGRSHVLSFIR